MAPEPHATFARALAAARNPDGAWPPAVGGASEPEPTAVATLALDDAGGRAWLAAAQRPDGGVGLRRGAVSNDSATSLAALALQGSARERALDHLLASRAVTLQGEPERQPRGWGWTPETYGWVEPTARALLAIRLHRPWAGLAIDDAVGTLRARACIDGGWNYGNRDVLGTALPPYGQTTAIALLALQGEPSDLSSAGRGALERLWPQERGGLTLALTVAALRLDGAGAATHATEALGAAYERSGFLGDVTALAWATLATGPALERIRLAG